MLEELQTRRFSSTNVRSPRLSYLNVGDPGGNCRLRRRVRGAGLSAAQGDGFPHFLPIVPFLFSLLDSSPQARLVRSWTQHPQMSFQNCKFRHSGHPLLPKHPVTRCSGMLRGAWVRRDFGEATLQIVVLHSFRSFAILRIMGSGCLPPLVPAVHAFGLSLEFLLDCPHDPQLGRPRHPTCGPHHRPECRKWRRLVRHGQAAPSLNSVVELTGYGKLGDAPCFEGTAVPLPRYELHEVAAQCGSMDH